MDVFKGAQNKAGQMEWQALGALNLITIGKSSLKNPQALRGEARASERQEDSTEPPSSISSLTAKEQPPRSPFTHHIKSVSRLRTNY